MPPPPTEIGLKRSPLQSIQKTKEVIIRILSLIFEKNRLHGQHGLLCLLLFLHRL